MIKRFAQGIPRAVWIIGISSFLLNTSAIICFTYIPVYMTVTFGASLSTIGALEGIVESTALLTRVISGMLSDKLKRRQLFLRIGYGTALVARVILTTTTTLTGAFAARFLDRCANGIHASPRDALVGDWAPVNLRGACHGLRHSWNTSGSVVGSLLGMALMYLTGGNFRLVFLLSTVPMVLAFCSVSFFVKDAPVLSAPSNETFCPSSLPLLKRLQLLPWRFWFLIAFSFCLSAGTFSGAFFILSARQKGMADALLPIIMIVQNLMTGMVAYPIGRLADRMPRRFMLALGPFNLIISSTLLGFFTSLPWLFVSVTLFGIQQGVVSSTLLLTITELCPAPVRATGFGIFHMANGLGILVANNIMGRLAHTMGLNQAFLSMALIPLLCYLFILFLPQGAERDKRSS